MRKKRRIRMKITGILILLVVCVCFAVRGIGGRDAFPVMGEADEVRAEELAGYLTIVPLSPEETRQLILPALKNEVLTAADVRVLFEKLNLSQYYEELTAGAELAEDKPLTRAQWTTVYEALLQKLGVREQVSEADIQYLGDVNGEERIIADNGNYDCDRESCHFTYGKTYTVYLKGNFILGRKGSGPASASGQPEDTADSGQPGKTGGAGESGDAAGGDDAADGGGDKDQVSGHISVPETVRVLLTQDNGEKIYRSNVWVKCAAGLKLSCGDKGTTVGKNRAVNCKKLLKKWQGKKLRVEPAGKGRLYLTGRTGKKVYPYGYRGAFCVHADDNGLWVVNELSMEQYLYGVVPGEVPESFAPEAQKAQAVCARTYASRRIGGDSYKAYEADVNDTTDCQVYMTSGENKKARSAVNATKGQVLTAGNKLAATYYYASSCGYTSGTEVWDMEPVSYLKTVSLLTETEEKRDFEEFIRDTSVTAYDSDSHYFRWTASLNLRGGSEKMKDRLNSYLRDKNKSVSAKDKAGQTIRDCSLLGTCTGMKVKKRAESGTVTDLMLTFSKGTVHICHENIIRNVLGEAVVSVTDKNGKKSGGSRMLPSAAFAAEKGKKGRYTLYGGGFGHGIGMSQDGADGMAKAGMSCEQILQTFFAGTTVTEGEH